MNAEANGHSSTAVRTSSRAALRISLIPDPRSSPGNSQPSADARAPSPRDPSELSVADADHHMQTRVKHPDGGDRNRTAVGTQADGEAQREKIPPARGMGSHRQDRLPRWLYWIPKFVPFVNFALLLYVFARLRRLR